MTVSFSSAGAIISSASAATLTPVLPAANGGDAYIALLAIMNNATVAAPTGWTKLLQSNPSASFTVAIYVNVSSGSTANPVFSWTGAAACAAVMARYVGEAHPGLLGTNGGPSSGTTNPHTSASFNSTALNSLAAAFDIQASATAQATTPSGWTGNFALGDSTSGISFAGWSKTLGPSGTASGAISVTETAVAWFEIQFEILEDPLPGQICI